MIIISAAGASLLSQHAAHLLAVGIPVGMVGLGLGIDWWRRRVPRPHRGGVRRGPLRAAALASVGAAAVHLRVMPPHFRESAWYGLFFAGAAAGQFLGAWLLMRAPTWPFVLAVATANAAVICLWIVTRVVGVPIGPDAGSTESFGALDLTAGVCELVVVLGCLEALMTRRQPGRLAADGL